MATSSITANFYCDDAKAYLPSEASFAQQSGYSSANAFVRMLVSPVRDSPSRRAKALLLNFTTVAAKRDFVRRFRAKWSKRKVA